MDEKADEQKADNSADTEAVSAEPEAVGSSDDAAESPMNEDPSSPQPPDVTGATATEASPATPTNEHDPSDHPAHRRGDKTRERLHRASEVALGVTRGVIEEPAKRVEKIRHASTHVIEEASYDPSLRFVLVALGLFVVFVILLVLSKVMG